MRNHVHLTVLAALVLATGACSTPVDTPGAPPEGFVFDPMADRPPDTGPIVPVIVEPISIPPLMATPRGRTRGGGRPEGPVDESTIDGLLKAARRQPPNPAIASMVSQFLRSPLPIPGFDHMDFATSGQNFVPPDPELAVGPMHLVSVVNDALIVTDHVGTPMLGPVGLPTFFATTPGCTNLFDPNVLYDEQLDRFIVGIDANGVGYCVAMSQTPDPLLPWNVYSFATVPPPIPPANPDFFDYPHAGVGDVAIYMGANIFDPTGTTFLRAEVWAMDKTIMAAGGPLPFPVSQPVLNGFTPQPMNAHGWWQQTWPAGQPHTIVANQYLPAYSADLIDVWQWSDPFGVSASFTKVGTVDLSLPTFPATYPIDAPQNAGANIQANDWRVLDCEYRNGTVWTAQNISCNPGGGLVDCIRWAEIDPVTPGVVQAGVLGTDGEYRIFPDVAVNHCDDMTVGYTKTSTMMFPEVWATGRLGTDPPGMLAPEAPLVAAVAPYVSWDGPPHRWGDYTGGTSGPDGDSTWYLGQYSKNLMLPPPSANWGTWVNPFVASCDADLQTTIDDGVTQAIPGGSVTYTITVTNGGRGTSNGALVTAPFPAELTGVQWTCAGQSGPPTAACGSASGTGDISVLVDLEPGSTVTLTASGTIAPAATGSLAVTASAASNGIQDLTPGNDSATDTDTLVPTADVSATVDNGQTWVGAGTTTTYTVVVSNTGPSRAPAVSASSGTAGSLTVTGWTCTPSGGALCGAASGSGALADTPDLPPGTSVTYTVAATVGAGATGTVACTVSTAPGSGVIDPAAGNDSATDTDPVGADIFADGFENGTWNQWSSSSP
jgi:uncharacterized repeat protein (TIGR01451 family)